MSQTKYTCTCGWNVYGKSSTRKCKSQDNCGEAWCPAALSAGTVRDPPKKLADKTQAADKVQPKPSAKVQIDDNVTFHQRGEERLSPEASQTEVDDDSEESEEPSKDAKEEAAARMAVLKDSISRQRQRAKEAYDRSRPGSVSER